MRQAVQLGAHRARVLDRVSVQVRMRINRNQKPAQSMSVWNKREAPLQTTKSTLQLPTNMHFLANMRPCARKISSPNFHNHPPQIRCVRHCFPWSTLYTWAGLQTRKHSVVLSCRQNLDAQLPSIVQSVLHWHPLKQNGSIQLSLVWNSLWSPVGQTLY